MEKNQFETLGVDQDILKSIKELGFNTPTPIQEKIIPILLTDPQDVVGLAQTGTGKTAAFGIPAVQLVDVEKPVPQALVIAPTRELCLQICNDMKNYARHKMGLRFVAVYGGASIENQIKDLNRGAQIIVATPGRMVDIISRRKVNLKEVKIVVLDEADEMLNMGFKEDLDDILGQTPDNKVTWLFSATMPSEVARIARTYMENPLEVSTGKQNQSADNISHIYYKINIRDKYRALKRILDFHPDIFGIIFCRTKQETQDIADNLMNDGYSADSLHGDLSQHQRDVVMKKFRSKQLQVLIATDVAARGIDVDNITHVIHYSLPDETENYTHRSGRTGRAGKSGISVVLAGSRDLMKIKDIERKIKKTFLAGRLPSGDEVMQKQLEFFINELKTTETSQIEDNDPLLKLFDDLSKEDLVKKIMVYRHNNLFKYYKNATDLNFEDTGRERRRSESSDFTDGASNKPFKRYFINIGRIDDLAVGELINFVCSELDCEKGNMGRIDLKNTFSFFELESKFHDAAMKMLKGKELKGRPVRIELSDMPGGDNRSSSHGSRGPRKEGGYEKKSYERNSLGGSSGYDKKRSGGDRPRINSSRGDNDRPRERKSSSGGDKPRERRRY